MYIHDVIASLRERDLKLAQEIRRIMMVLSTMEKYLSEVSDYPAPPVSRETEAHANGDATLF